MKTKVTICSEPKIQEAVQSISREISDPDARLVVYFASSRYPSEELAKAMASAFPGVVTVGCTTAGEMSCGKMVEHAISAMSFGSELIRRAEARLLVDIAQNPRKQVIQAFADISQKLGKNVADLDYQQYVGLVLVDGLSGAEERLMSALGDLTNLVFVGGSAGDDLQFKKTHVFVGPTAKSDAAVVVVIETATAFQAIKTQSFRTMPQRLVATKVDEAQRLVMEFNGEPAALAYAKAVGVPVEQAPSQFMIHPLGLVSDNEIFVRSPQRIDADGMRFYCSILDGMELTLLESTDILQDTRKAVEAVSHPLAILQFNCILRTQELRNKNQCTAYGAIFARIPTVGFSTYGEAYLGHINQTATMLVFQSP